MKSCRLEYMHSKLTNIDEKEYKESEWTVTPVFKKKESREKKKGENVIVLNAFTFTCRLTFKH